MQESIFNQEQKENGTPRQKTIVLKSVYKTKNGKYFVQPVFSKKTNWFLGVQRLSEDDKKSLTYWTAPDSMLTLIDGYVFDLNDPIDAANWEWVKHSPRIAGSFEQAQQTPGAQLYVHSEIDEAAKSITSAETLYKAMKYVMEDKVVNYVGRARLLGVDMKYDEPQLIKELLVRTAREHSEQIIHIYESDKLAIQLLFYEAVDKKVIEKQGKVYTYAGTTLGLDEGFAISFLSETKNSTIVDLIDRDVNPEYFVEDNEVKPKSITPTKSKARTKK